MYSGLSDKGLLNYQSMRTKDFLFALFLKDIMRRRNRLPSQLAQDIGISHATVSRWLSGEDVPSPRSCQKLAEYSCVPLPRVLSLAGHLPEIVEQAPVEWPEFGEYARRKYPNELDEDLITVIEEFIERRRKRNPGLNNS